MTWRVDLTDQLREIAQLPEEVILGMANDVITAHRVTLREIALIVTAHAISQPRVIHRHVTDEVKFRDTDPGAR